MAAVVCGFCRRGVDAVEVCGKLWHDSDKNCTAHQRCMVRFSWANLRASLLASKLRLQVAGMYLSRAIDGFEPSTDSAALSTGPI